MIGTCAKCQFFEWESTGPRGEARGLCRFHAPTFGWEGWPTVIGHDWCGQFRGRYPARTGPSLSEQREMGV